ncbi:MAG: DUF2294 domain-containing protein [Actinobacteria bacterium]|nr:MAG: DUF2294 domain-containing protein [Actinomycetota bacterium]
MSSEPNDRARRATTISNAMTQMHREYYGRGATSVRTVIDRNHVVTFLEDILTPMERTLVDAGEIEPVRQARLAFQKAMRTRFIDTIESATGRKVRAFLSQVHFDPDIAAELFVLEPNGTQQDDAGG